MIVRGQLSFLFWLVVYCGAHAMCNSGFGVVLHKMLKQLYDGSFIDSIGSYAALKLCKHNRFDVGFEALDTAEFLCTSIRLVQLAIFPE